MEQSHNFFYIVQKSSYYKYKRYCVPALCPRKEKLVVVVPRTTEKTMTEKQIEQKLVKAVKAKGGLAPKFVSPGFDGVPDRIVLLPRGRIAFIELKAKGRKMRPLQVRRKRQLKALGFSVYCIDSPEQIAGILDEIQSS